jgi:TetR/AcrR family transcriptional regulator, ethionamide resistance regulator
MESGSSATQVRPARGRRVRRSTGDDRERAILETAETLLEAQPLQEISVDDLARGAGISRPTFYFYFASKEAVLLTLLDRMVEEARVSRGDVLEHFPEDPAPMLHQALSAVYRTFRAHRAAALAAAGARATSAEVREMWAGVMETFVQETTRAIEAERARGAAPDGLPARELAVVLNQMNESVLHATFAGHTPSVGEEDVVDVLVEVWFRAIYGTPAPLDRTD